MSPVSTIKLTQCAVNNETEKGVSAVLGVLEEIATIAKDIPPVDNAASRFGNPAFRTFYDKVSEVSKKNIILAFECL